MVRYARNAIFRLAFFLCYYIFLIVLGIAILAGTFWGGWYVIWKLLPMMHSVRLIVFSVLGVLCLCVLAVMVGLYLVKPLFKFSRSTKKNRIEVFENEVPQLFGLIRDIAGKAGCRMPKHVFLTPQVGASVFFDSSSLLGIFINPKMNLNIGLGLFDGMSVKELEAVLSHEYGHFSQKTMKLWYISGVVIEIMGNLINSEDALDYFVDKWSNIEYWYVRFFGVCTRKITGWIGRCTHRLYKSVENSQLRLSRQMEYDADKFACKVTGVEYFVSAWYKTEILERKDELYMQLITSLAQEGKLVSDYYAGRTIFSSIIDTAALPSFGSSDLIDNFEEPFTCKSSLKMENVWSTHPTLEQRIEAAQKLPYKAEDTSCNEPAWNLIARTVQDKAAAKFREVAYSLPENKDVDELSLDEIKDYVLNESCRMKEDEFPDRYFTKGFYKFNVDSEENPPEESPFTDENAMLIARMSTYLDDYRKLTNIQNGEMGNVVIEYEGKQYTNGNFPYDEFKKKVDDLYDRMGELHRQLYLYMKASLPQEEAIQLKQAYSWIFTSNSIYAQYLSGLFEQKDMIFYAMESESAPIGSERYLAVSAAMCQFEKDLKEAISQIDMEQYADVLNCDGHLESLRVFVSKDHNLTYGLKCEAITETVTALKILDFLRNELYDVGYSRIRELARKVI